MCIVLVRVLKHFIGTDIVQTSSSSSSSSADWVESEGTGDSDNNNNNNTGNLEGDGDKEGAETTATTEADFFLEKAHMCTVSF